AWSPYWITHSPGGGGILAQAATPNRVDGTVAVPSADLGAVIVTSDPGDIQHLLDRLGPAGRRAEVAPLR
ncbi:hypothetical protein, partial [Streptomyces mirabilis]|uniref:hypothetical protein n=1 Tax=Streptomyces mirabilis TaxID=68239 RepID=UPI0036CBE159